MKYLFVLLLVVYPEILIAQTLAGIVLNKSSDKPIGFATIIAKYKGRFIVGTSADEKANFFLDIANKRVDSIFVSAVGYQESSFPYEKSEMTVFLMEKAILLNTVDVFPSGVESVTFGVV